MIRTARLCRESDAEKNTSVGRPAGTNVYAVATRGGATQLSALLAAKADGRSARSIARAANEVGHTLNHDTAARYLRGDHGTPDEATLRAFAEVLQIPLAELRKAADLPWESTAPYVPPPESSRLTRRQRLAVDEIIRAMLDPRAETTGRRAAPVRSAAKAAPRAARRGRAEPPAD